MKDEVFEEELEEEVLEEADHQVEFILTCALELAENSKDLEEFKGKLERLIANVG